MRFVLIVLIMLFATGDVMADTSREDKIAYIIETEDLRGQIIAYKEEMIKRSIEELDKDAIDDLSEKQKSIIVEESAAIVEEYVDDYIKELVDVYEEHITDDEIDALYNFYRSPEGLSLGSKLPAIWRETFWIDARYLELLSERAVSRIAERLSQEGNN